MINTFIAAPGLYVYLSKRFSSSSDRLLSWDVKITWQFVYSFSLCLHMLLLVVYSLHIINLKWDSFTQKINAAHTAS